MKLYGYFLSSASYRVRIALNLKGLAYDTIPVDLLKNGGQQHAASYHQLNPASLVPLLIDDQIGAPLLQSLAIIEYLEETHPQPPLLPANAADRAYVRAIALAVACDIHPLNNLRVLRYLKREMGMEQHARDAWYRHWCEQGLVALETMLAADPTGRPVLLREHANLGRLLPDSTNRQRPAGSLRPVGRADLAAHLSNVHGARQLQQGGASQSAGCASAISLKQAGAVSVRSKSGLSSDICGRFPVAPDRPRADHRCWSG